MITIDYQNRKPIYEQIVERFQMLIVREALEAGSQIPSVRSLAMELSINPNTIQKAYTLLEQEGFIYSVKGRGNFVSGNHGLIGKKRQAFFDSFLQILVQGRELGISKDECLNQVEDFYKEGDK